MNVGFLREVRGGAASDRDGFHAEAAHDGQHHQDFRAFTGIADGEQGVIGGNHAEVAMPRFGCVDEEGGGAGAGQRCRDFFANMSRFAKTGHDDVAARGEDAIASGKEGGAEVVDLRAHGFGFLRKDGTGVGKAGIGHG